jgi:hypothetical protein
MADQEKRPPYLRIVIPPTAPGMRPAAQDAVGVRPASKQLDLIDGAHTSLWLVLVTSEWLRNFPATVAQVRPRFIFDLRPLPVFDAVGMSRQIAFRHVETIGAMYLDALGAAGIRERRNAFIHSGGLTKYVDEFFGKDVRGPLLFLFDSKDDLLASSRLLPMGLRTPDREEWRLRVLDGSRVP